MKKTYVILIGVSLLIASCKTKEVAPTDVQIPDKFFEQTLIDKGIDKDKTINGQMAYSDALTVENLFLIYNEDISSLKGIEAFVNLKRFACSSSKINTLDLQNSPKLTYVYCNHNTLLSSVNFTNNKNIDTLIVNSNYILQKIDVGNLEKLNDFTCQTNGITELDVSKNTLLTSLRCDINKIAKLTLGNLKNLHSLSCDSNKLTALDVSQLPNLTGFTCFNNSIKILDTKNNIKLTRLSCTVNQIEVLDITNNKLLEYFDCIDNPIKNSVFDFTNNNKLTTINLSGNFTKINVSTCKDLTDMLIWANNLTQLDVSKNIVLSGLRVRETPLSSINLDNNINLKLLECTKTNLTTLDIRKQKLEGLNCTNNPSLKTICVLSPADYINQYGYYKDPTAQFVMCP